MINIVNKRDCCGCSACVEICPKQCISFDEDIEGFRYPIASKKECIDCHLCEKVCPFLNKFDEQKPIDVYAAKNRNTSERLKSSSGGLFIEFAKAIISKKGVVFGVVYDDDFYGVHHTYAENLKIVYPMMQSKYLQSFMGHSYKDCENFLKAGRLVLFSGTSCQIAGLLHFLRKTYQNLYTVDVVCHGVPSTKVWRRYLDEEKCNFPNGLYPKNARSGSIGGNTVFDISLKTIPSIEDVNFRDKSEYGWKKFGFSLKMSIHKADKNPVLLSYKTTENPFFNGFVVNMFMRMSCFACKAKGGSSHSDITICDYWGIEEDIPSFDDDKGTSLLIVNTIKGYEFVKDLNFETLPANLGKATSHNMAYYKSYPENKYRAKFYKLFSKEKLPLAKMVTISLRPSIRMRIINKIKRLLEL